MSHWAFHSQIFFLVHKFNAHRTFLATGSAMIQDRTIYEDAEVFAQHLSDSGFMSIDETKTYRDLYTELIQLLPSPTLMIYLQADVDTLFHRIKVRGRPEEQNIPRDYMKSLHALYESWFRNYDRSPKLLLNVDGLDFVNNEADREVVIHQIKDALNQL